MDLYEVRQQFKKGKTIYDLPLKVSYYARVSTDFEEQLHSLKAQVEYYNDMINKASNWTLYKGYIDEGLSGTSMKKRKSFNEMVEDAKSGKFNLIITKEISRFSRNVVDSLNTTQILLLHNVGVYFESDNINTFDEDSELRLTIMTSIAQDEVRKTSNRVKFGLSKSIENGVVLGNSKIWGYDKKDGKLTINENESPFIKKIFDLYANQNLGMRSISNTLFDNEFTTRNGNPLSFYTIKTILTNPKYKGFYCGKKSVKLDFKDSKRKYFEQEDWVIYKDNENVPPIVSEELWEKANEKLKERQLDRRKSNTGYHNKYTYSGKIICSLDNCFYYRTVFKYASGEKEAWQCKEYKSKGKKGCNSPTIYTQELDHIICDILSQIKADKNSFIEKMTNSYSSKDTTAKSTEKIKALKNEIDGNDKRKDKLLDLNIDGKISDDEFEKRNNILNEKNQDLYKKINELSYQQNKFADVENQIKMISKTIEQNQDTDTKITKEIIDTLIDKIEVVSSDNGNIRLDILLNLNSDKITANIKREKDTTSIWYGQHI